MSRPPSPPCRECGAPHHAKGLCVVHYMQAVRTPTPELRAKWRIQRAALRSPRAPDFEDARRQRMRDITAKRVANRAAAKAAILAAQEARKTREALDPAVQVCRTERARYDAKRFAILDAVTARIKAAEAISQANHFMRRRKAQ